MTDEFRYDVFLSHSTADRDRVWSIYEQMRDSGLHVWLYEQDVRAGDSIPLKIDEGLTSSRALVLCLSPDAVQTDWVKLEYQTAIFRDPLNRKRRFVPLLLSECQIPETVRQFRFIDFRQPNQAAWSELLAACSPISPTDSPIRPLHVVEDRFLQVLLYQFSLQRADASGAVDLRVAFNEETPTIWNPQGKRYLRTQLTTAACSQYQLELDNFLIDGKGSSYEFSDARFPFRFASGGTLPIVNLIGAGTRRAYYCFFYRDVDPIGWNIANGGCDTRAELMNPEETIERELREELIIADFRNDIRYVFPPDRSKPLEHPAHSVARRLFALKHPAKNLNVLRVEDVPIEVGRGPDVLHVQFGSDTPWKRDGFYININGDDFGIEFDRTATITLPDTVTLFDGEIDGEHLVNCPVGLFDVEVFTSAVVGGIQTQFRPDILFYNAERYPSEQLDSVVEDFIDHLVTFRRKEEIDKLRLTIKERRQFGLCPVTSRIVRRVIAEAQMPAKRI